MCHRNHLVQPDGRYCGLAPVSECRSCLAVDADGFEEPDPGERRAAFGAFLAGAARVFAPSCDTAARIRTVYPDLRGHGAAACRAGSGRCARPPCSGPAASAASPSSARSAPRRAACSLQALATDAQDRDLPLRFAIVGYSDPALADRPGGRRGRPDRALFRRPRGPRPGLAALGGSGAAAGDLARDLLVRADPGPAHRPAGSGLRPRRAGPSGCAPTRTGTCCPAPSPPIPPPSTTACSPSTSRPRAGSTCRSGRPSTAT
ncbi:hypothetical protein ACU4GR_04905 [Methylobacterium oryzae CBMB20]